MATSRCFIHDRNNTHNIMQFLQEAVMKVTANKGTWNLWYDPVPEAERAKDKVKQEFVDMQVDEGQFIRRSKLARVNESDDESSSIESAKSATSMKSTKSKNIIKSDESSKSSRDKDWPVRLKKNPRYREAERRAEREREEEQLRQVKHAKVKRSAKYS